MRQYGQIAGSNRINCFIYRCFEYITEEDQQKFVRQFQQQPDDSDQIMHTLRELVLGAYLNSRGFRTRYDCLINGGTPDWTILAPEGDAINGIVELTNFHIDKATANEIEEPMRVGGIAVYWRDTNIDNIGRLYQAIWKKATKYRSVAKDLEVPYVVGMFGEFTAAVHFEEVCLCLLDEKSGLFSMYPKLSGVLYFEEISGQYSFSYASNPSASRAIELPAGIFPSEAA